MSELTGSIVSTSTLTAYIAGGGDGVPAPHTHDDRYYTETQLATPYRDGGWTTRQVIHHVADSHVNAYVRTRWLLTEDRPTLKAYDEKAWAELPDAALAPIELSLALIDALHARWHALLTSVADAEFSREIVHPDRGPMSLETLVQMYAWHGRHHLAHLQLVAGQPA